MPFFLNAGRGSSCKIQRSGRGMFSLEMRGFEVFEPHLPPTPLPWVAGLRLSLISYKIFSSHWVLIWNHLSTDFCAASEAFYAASWNSCSLFDHPVDIRLVFACNFILSMYVLLFLVHLIGLIHSLAESPWRESSTSPWALAKYHEYRMRNLLDIDDAGSEDIGRQFWC